MIIVKEKLQKMIPIAMITDRNFIMPTCVAITSILQNKDAETVYDFFILTVDCLEKDCNRIKKCFENSDSRLNIFISDVEKYKCIKQIAHIPIACLLKFDICDIINEYDKILYLDGDIIVRNDLAELYNTNLDGKYAAAVKELGCSINDTENINAGIMLFNAERIRSEELSIKLYDTRIKLGDRGSMDQQTFNIVTEKQYIFLPIKYNCVPSKVIGRIRDKRISVSSVNKLYDTNYHSMKNVFDEATIVHYATGDKPWKYTFNPGAKEWYKYYRLSPYKNDEIDFDGIWKYRIKKIKNVYSQQGTRGLAEYFMRKNKKREEVKWE